MTEEKLGQPVDMNKGNTRRTLYNTISGEFGEGGVVGLGERLERVYRGLYQLTLDHPRFSRALENGDEATIKIKRQLEGYGEEVQSIQKLITQGGNYEKPLAVLTARFKTWANIVEEKYRDFASNLVNVVEEIELQLDRSASFSVLMNVNELMRYVDEIKASVKQGTVTVQVDNKALDTAVRNALSGVKDELERYIQGEIAQVVGRTIEGLKRPEDQDPKNAKPKPAPGSKSPRKRESSGRPEGEPKVEQQRPEAGPPEPTEEDQEEDVNADEFLDGIFKEN